MIKVQVTLIGSLYKYLHGEKTKKIDFQEGTSAEDILRELGIPSEYCSFMMVNGLKAPRSYMLCEGDEVVVFPLVSGG